MQIKVTQNEVKINKDILNDGEYNIHKCQFDFDEEYNGLVQKAVFSLNDGTPYLMTIVNNECNIPIEVLEEGVLKIGVYAYETNNDELVLRYSPSPDIIHVFDGSYVKDAQNTEPITPTDKEQIEQAITNLQNDVTDLEENKQDTLVSGENIKTINGESVLGSGNIEIDLSNYYNKQEIDQSQASQNTNITKNTNDIATLNNKLTNYSLITETGSQIVLNVNPSNYQMTAILKDKNGNTIYTSNVIDLPIESMIVNVTYDSTTKEIVFTLQNGTTLRVSVADLVSGLVSTDELNTILASYYTKAEIDTLLSGKVDTTTYTQGQATQDANIEENASNIDWLQTLVNQMPTVSGQGTDLSLQDVLNYRLMKFLPQGVSSQDGEPTPTTPIPIKTVTGENSLVISNSDNSELQTYPISLGNIELNSSPDGTVRDGIYGSPNGWYKREYIRKMRLQNAGSSGGTFSVMQSNGYICRYLSNTGSLGSTDRSQLWSNRFKGTNLGLWNGANGEGVQLGTGGGSLFIAMSYATLENYYGSKLTSSNYSTAWKNYFDDNETYIYFPLEQYTDIPITDTTLINQLNNIYNNAHSYNGVTNITTTYEDGNEQMYLDIEALAKSGSTTAETDPTVPSYVKGITQQNITDWNDKQDELVSGTNIKTINNESLLGSGNITIQGGGSSYTAGTNIEITNENVINNTIPFEGTSGNGFVVGQKKTNTTINTSAVGIGKKITASGLQTVVIGNNATGSNQMNVAIGEYAIADNSFGIAIGRGAGTHGDSSTVIGYGAVTYQSSSIALGRDANARQSNLFQIGSYSYPINKVQISTSTGDKELATTDFLTTLSGYDATKTQVLKNVNGTLTWVDE